MRGGVAAANLFSLASLEPIWRGFSGRFAVWGQNRSAGRGGFGDCVGELPLQTCDAMVGGRYVNHLKNANFAEYEECAFCLPREHLQESDGGVYIQENGSGRRV